VTNHSRRNFIKTSAIGGLSLMGASAFGKSFRLDLPANASTNLYQLSHQLIQQWGDALLALQITDKTRVDDYGGIYCTADKAVHGRVGDAIYPLFYLAGKTQDHKYIDAAQLLYQWIERRVSQPDGSWLNEPVAGSWKGTTVFASIALAETIKNHCDLMDPGFKVAVSARLIKAGNYIYDNFNMAYGNINYPVTAAYGLSLLGMVLDVPKFKQRGKELADEALKYFSPKNKLLYGEGDITTPSKKGCYSVDLGYNVEESMPALVMYGLLNNDKEILDAATLSMQAHMELMLPDGGWDNSWGTRNYKWSYWGSRTSDGCQTAYALMADRDPRFYKVALRNTQLMQQCTVNGLLQGGPHYASHHVPVCVHHTFSHIKALTTTLDYSKSQKVIDIRKIHLPREEQYGSRFMPDIQTYLVAKHGFKATITGYDKEYKKTKNGHATGGALTILWHAKTGPLLSASMNEYQIFEAGNQQVDDDPHSMALTPRIELRIDGKLYMNISDLGARMEIDQNPDQVTINTFSKLVDKDQAEPSSPVNCQVSYQFINQKSIIKFKYDKTEFDGQVKIIVPVISKSTERVVSNDNKTLMIKKDSALVKISANQPMTTLPTTNGRIFNYVPGFEAIPLSLNTNEATVQFEVIAV
jgi:hypothetical protein